MSTHLTPIITFTMCRHYYAFASNLRRLHSLKKEFHRKPIIRVIYARPEEKELDWLKKLRRGGYINDVVLRPQILHEETFGGTTYPESWNIRFALENNRFLYDDAYTIIQACDVYPTKGLYNAIDWRIRDYSVVSTGMGHNGTMLCTGLCAMRHEPECWPPVILQENAETLEYLWHQQLKDKGIGISYYPLNESFGWKTSHDIKVQRQLARG